MINMYGEIKKLLYKNYTVPDEVFLIESSFLETTRTGKYLRSVVLGLTSKNLAVASTIYCAKTQKNYQKSPPKYEKQLKLLSLYALSIVKIHVFKRHVRKSLKVITTSEIRYFQLPDTSKQKIYWKIWCNYCSELNKECPIWPFYKTSFNKTIKSKSWLDKHLYLGKEREKEDIIRPIPIPGLGILEETKLLYLKPTYFWY